MNNKTNFTLNQKEEIQYNTVVFAGLLHDIGKFFGRIEKKRFPKHPAISAMFLENPIIEGILKREGIGIDSDLLKILVLHHHEHKAHFEQNFLVQSLTDPLQKSLAYIVSRADTYSSHERDDEEDLSRENYKNYRLYSTFSLIDTTDRKKPDKYYKLHEFTIDSMFPVDYQNLQKDTYSYVNLETKLMEMFKRFEPQNFTQLFNGFYSIFRKFLWAVPSDTWRKKSDISLFDHLSTTSSISAALYFFHYPHFNENEIKNDKIQKFLLISGGFSGIQDFLFELHQQNPRKLSKTLRGRSFLLSLLTEIISLKILKTLKLPHSSKLMNSGSRFLILAPNRESVKHQLQHIAKEIEIEFFKIFLGKLTFTLDFSTQLDGIDMRIGNFKDKINESNTALIRKKLNKHNFVLKDTDYYDYLNKPHGHNLQENGVCSFCGIFPKEKSGKDEKCLICNISEKLGEKIPEAQYLHFLDSPSFFTFLNIGVDLTPHYKPAFISYSLEELGNSTTYSGNLFYNIANYLPTNNKLISDHNDDLNTLCYYCKNNDLKTQCLLENRQLFKDTFLSFECIAVNTPYQLKREGKGTNKLAVFKADIDNLGYLTQFGFDKVNEEETSKYSISRYTFVSRMLDYFFQYKLKHFIKNKYPMIYTVYAGGDDLLLIGPWDDITRFSFEFYSLFKQFIGENPDITISAGISLFSPHAPVPQAVEKAEHNLNLAKNEIGKNSISFFDTTVQWDSLPELFEFSNFLDEEVNNEHSPIQIGYIYRLFKYHQMYLDFKKGKVEGLRFHSLMNYDIKRNIEKRKGEEILNQKTLDRLKPLYSFGSVFNINLMKNLKIPLYKTLLKNRGGK